MGSSQRIVWGFADQAINSLTNFGLAIIVARTVSAIDFGVFAATFALYLLAAGVGQGLASLPLSVKYSASGPVIFRTGARDAMGSVLTLGVIVGAALALGGAVIDRSLGRPLMVLGVMLPGLLLQDAWRYVFAAQGHPERAAINDLVWALVQIIAIAVLIITRATNLLTLLAAWGGAANVGALFGITQFSGTPRPFGTLRWLRNQWELCARYAAEAVIVRGSSQLALVIVALVAGLGALGSLRGAQLVYGPLSFLFLGGLFASVPEGVRALETAPSRLHSLVKSVSIATSAVALIWGLIASFFFPSIGRQVLGVTEPGAYRLVIPAGAQYLFAAATIGPQVGLKAMAAASRTLRAQGAQASLTLFGAACGAVLAGARGAAIGLAAATAVAALVWWLMFETQLHFHALPVRAPGPTVPGVQ